MNTNVFFFKNRNKKCIWKSFTFFKTTVCYEQALIISLGKNNHDKEYNWDFSVNLIIRSNFDIIILEKHKFLFHYGLCLFVCVCECMFFPDPFAVFNFIFFSDDETIIKLNYCGRRVKMFSHLARCDVSFEPLVDQLSCERDTHRPHHFDHLA
jgi:hypothetical protein